MAGTFDLGVSKKWNGILAKPRVTLDETKRAVCKKNLMCPCRRHKLTISIMMPSIEQKASNYQIKSMQLAQQGQTGSRTRLRNRRGVEYVWNA
jgi:hypothetical protein